MNTDRMAKIAKRAESRRQRAIGREQRRLRRLSKHPSAAAIDIPTRVAPAMPIGLPVKKTIAKKPTGGCGGCRKKAEKFKKTVQSQAVPTPVQKGQPTLIGKTAQPVQRPR